MFPPAAEAAGRTGHGPPRPGHDRRYARPAPRRTGLIHAALAHMALMTPAQAQRLQDEARAAGRSLMWFVAASEAKARAWAVMAGPRGGIRLPDELVANTLAELRETLP